MQYTLYTLLLIIAGSINLILAFYSLSYYNSAGSKTYSVLMLLVAEWSFAYALEMANTTLNVKLFWAQAQYLAIAFIPIVWLYFSLQYTDQGRWLIGETKKLGWLLIGPMITVVLAFTNNAHGLIRQDTYLEQSGSFISLSFTYGYWFWIHLAFSYFCLLIGTIVLVNAYRRSKSIYRNHIGVIIVGALFPWLANILHVARLNPFPGLDLTPFAFTITGIVTAIGMSRFQFLNILPVAHNMIIESMHDGILVLDIQNCIVDMNPAAESITQQEARKTIGIPFDQFLAHCLPLSGGSTNEHGIIAEMIMGTGEKARYYEVQSIQLTNANQKQTGRLIMLHETTGRKQFEVALQKAKDAAETAASTKSAFLANMSHEIRTPLNGVIGMAELLRNTPLSSEQVELVETIYTSSDTLLAIINSILDFSKIEAGKVELEQEPFDLRDCLEVSLNLITTRINTHSVKLGYTIDEQTPNAFIGDVIRLRQVLVNLLSNAAKFTEEGEISVNITSKLTENGQYQLHFVVKDTGIGISADNISALFQSFTQADASTTRKYGGTGLGLAISQKLCQLMGGDIWVESQVGLGSTFHFTIIAEKSTRQPARLLQTEQSHLGGKRLLIIAANADMRRAISRDARSWGMTPYVAGNGQEALYWISKSEAYDIAMLDHAILENEGVALLEEIHSSHKKALPLVRINSEEGQEYDDAHLFGAQLPPSFTSSQLNNILAGIFSTVQSATTDAAPPTRAISNMAEQHPLRILLAEDNRVNQKVATRLLGKLGYEVDVAENGRVTIEVLKKQPYDVILMDIQMPEMDGVEATAAIRAQWPPEQQPKIIAMTAHALEGDREHYLGQSMDDYISKPIQIDKLVSALYRCAPVKVETASTSLASKTNALINQADLEDLFGPNANKFLEELLPIYLKEAEKSLSRMNEAISPGNTSQLKQAAHSLKGNSANIALNKIAELCKTMEKLDLAASHDEAVALVQQISQAVDEIKKQYLQNPETPQLIVNKV